jgi:2-oxoglutarate ferredoxin oxidoreductase subunit alpha
MGPSTGLPTRTSQGDLGFAAHMGHGDTNHIVLLPGSVNECFEFGWKAFDIAERVSVLNGGELVFEGVPAEARAFTSADCS